MSPSPRLIASACIRRRSRRSTCGGRAAPAVYLQLGAEEWQRQYQAFKAGQCADCPTADALKKQFNAIREAEFPWTYDMTKCVVEGAFDDLGKAYKNFFAKRAKYPTFKKKGRSKESFYLSNDKFRVGDDWVQVPLLGDFIVRQQEANGTAITKREQQKRRLGKSTARRNCACTANPGRHYLVSRRLVVPLRPGRDSGGTNTRHRASGGH